MREMKDSGIEWIGKIPVSWNICKTKNVFAIKKIIANKLGYDILSVTQNGLKIKDISNNEGQISSDYSKYQIVDKLDFVMNHMDLLTGWVDCAYMQGVTSPDYRVFRLIDNVLCDRKYYTRIFQLCYQQKLYFSIGQGVSSLGRWRLQTDKFQNFELPLPPFAEQTTIANYLDDKCGKIDATIQREKQHIEKLKEYRQSIITEAVTKGLDPTAPMKDSGIEWIGEVPKKWRVVKMKYLGTARNGLTYSPDDMSDSENGILVLRSSNIRNGSLDFNDNVYVDMKISDNMKVSQGDILICSRNGSKALIGKNAIITENLFALFGAFMMIFKTNSVASYMHKILNSNVFDFYLSSFLTSTINQLTLGNFNNMKIVYTFDKTEQTTIADYLDHKTAQIDSAIAKKETLIEKLTEYKKSLIYEAVTGKMEVSQ